MFFIILVTLLLFNSCWTKHYDYWYQKRIKNNTVDTLLVLFGTNSEKYCGIDSIEIMPNSNYVFESSKGIDEGENPIILFFSDASVSFTKQARVYRNDSLKVTWNGPAQEMPDSIHHFYNYNSWEQWMIDDEVYDGIVQFTIYESDFE
jgi:hypothetical protein